MTPLMAPAPPIDWLPLRVELKMVAVPPKAKSPLPPARLPSPTAVPDCPVMAVFPVMLE